MLSHINRIVQAANDTLLHRAEGTMFDRLCIMYGFRRPQIIKQSYWRSAVQSGVFAARGTPGVIFKFLEHAFGQWIDECSTFEMTALSSNLMEVPLAQEDNCQLENRYFRIGEKLYRSERIDGRELTFYAVDCPMFNSADFVGLQEYTAKMMPFDVKEEGGLYKVLLDDGILNVPPTYLKQDASVVRGTGEPFGGHILDFTSAEEGERFGDQVNGPFPAYLAVDDFTSALGEGFMQLLVAGVRGQILDIKHCAGTPSLYGSYKQLLQTGTTSPDGPTLITPTRG